MIVPYVKEKQMRKVKGKDNNLVLRFALSAPRNSIRASPEKWIKIERHDNDDCVNKYYKSNEYDDDDNNLNI